MEIECLKCKKSGINVSKNPQGKIIRGREQVLCKCVECRCEWAVWIERGK